MGKNNTDVAKETKRSLTGLDYAIYLITHNKINGEEQIRDELWRTNQETYKKLQNVPGSCSAQIQLEADVAVCSEVINYISGKPYKLSNKMVNIVERLRNYENQNKMDKFDKILGCMYGLAIGDALGFPIEFMDIDKIKRKFGKEGVKDFETISILPSGSYSDDTQMTLAIANGLIKSEHPNELENVMENIVKEFIHWEKTAPRRAPGYTCMGGVENLKHGTHWSESGKKESKGCGAAMRSAPIGLFYDDTDKVVEVASAASICTHAHPTGIASGIATACLAYLAARDYEPEKMIDKICELTKEADKLGEFRNKMHQVKEVLDLEPEQAIPQLGEGWIGEEAVAIAMYSFLRSPKDYKKTVLTAANITGDTDSTACIAGAISGAYNGIKAIPEKWVKEVENSELIEKIAKDLYRKSKN